MTKRIAFKRFSGARISMKKELPAKSEELSSVPRTQRVEGENQSLQAVL